MSCINGPLLLPSNRESWFSPQPSKPKDAVQFINQEYPKYGFRTCTNPPCRNVFDRLSRVAPDSSAVAQNCPGLRSWVLTFTSCWVANPAVVESTERTVVKSKPPFGKSEAVESGGAIKDAIEFCTYFLQTCRGSKGVQIPTLNATVLGVCDLFYWVAYLFPTTETDEWEIHRGLGQQAITLTILQDDALNVTKGICHLRLWNTAQHTPRGLIELVSLKPLLQKPGTVISPRHLERHTNCSVELCWQNDENTTDVPQLHVHRAMDKGPAPFALKYASLWTA